MADLIDDLNNLTGQMLNSYNRVIKPVLDQRQNAVLAAKKVQALNFMNNSLAADPDALQDPSKFLDKVQHFTDYSGMTEDSAQQLKNFMNNIGTSWEQQTTSRLAAASSRRNLDLASNTFNQLRNSISAGHITPAQALKIYDKNIAPMIKTNLGAGELAYSTKAKSSLMLEGIQGMSVKDASAALQNDKYINGMTHDDYALAKSYVNKNAMGLLSGQDKLADLQKRIATGILDGTLTNAEINTMKENETGAMAEVIGNTAPIFNAVKGMSVDEINHFLETNQNLDPGLRKMLIARRQATQVGVTKDLVGWGEKAGEINPIDFNSTPTQLKQSMQVRLNDIDALEKKHSIAAQHLFTPDERRVLAYRFKNSTAFDKLQLLHAMATTINPARYKDLDSSLYKGAAADMLAMQTNPNADGFVHDSITGSDMLKEHPNQALSKTNMKVIQTEVSKLYSTQPNVVSSMSAQLQNIAVARGLGKGNETISDSTIKDMIHEVSDAHIEKGTSNSSPFKSTFLAKDKYTSRLLGMGLLNDDIANTIGSTTTDNYMKRADGSPISTADINKYGQFHTLAPNVYTCVITPKGRPPILLRDKKGNPVVFSTDHLTSKQKEHISIGYDLKSITHPVKWLKRKL